MTDPETLKQSEILDVPNDFQPPPPPPLQCLPPVCPQKRRSSRVCPYLLWDNYMEMSGHCLRVCGLLSGINERRHVHAHTRE